ncbi:hypothetical protein PR001_g2961 [Phytophthora rubi]|uniref:Uncharacterized protein n=1 Tax=Phytophthora rubi TaxID=129364 RepID=A0A6A3PBI7_9STRA|nr:hypothetical protein PR001_g2961 [Phytophthora rubi]
MKQNLSEFIVKGVSVRSLVKKVVRAHTGGITTPVVKSRHSRKLPLRLRADDLLYMRPGSYPATVAAPPRRRLAQHAPRQLPGDGRCAIAQTTRSTCAPAARLRRTTRSARVLEASRRRPLRLRADGSLHMRHLHVWKKVDLLTLQFLGRTKLLGSCVRCWAC